jgi:flagellar basal body-associated protein FliL
MNPHGDGKPEPIDPEQMLRILDIELMQKRALRKQATARRSSLRVVSFFFLFVVILGVAVAAYFAFTSGRVDELRARSNAPASPTPVVTSRP